MYKIIPLPELQSISANAIRHALILLFLLVVFTFNFAHRNGWKDDQAQGDDPVYIETAYNYWHSDAHPGRITWSPGYVQLMSPFVGVLGKETGYKIWRFILFAGVSLLVYIAFSRMFGSIWLGTALALFSQMFLTPYAAPTLQALVCLLYLFCFSLLADKTRFLGLAFGILLNGIFVSGAVGGVLFSFGILCVIFYPRLIFSRRFFAQFLASVALFGSVLYHLSYGTASNLNYAEEAAQRGRAGLYHQLSLYIVSSGRSTPYLKPGDDDAQNNADEYHRHLKAIDRYYLDKFGEGESDARAYRHDKRWPLFLLDWPWMMAKDPELMREYRHEVLKTLRDSLFGGDKVFGAFEIAFPFGDYGIHTKSFFKRATYNIVSVIFLMLILMLPHLIRLARKKPFASHGFTWPSRLQILFCLSCLSTLLPLMLVKPLPIYFPPLIPAYLMGIALLTAFFVNRITFSAGTKG